jgi:predicted acylesterase/phospholipase RssA
LFLGKDIPIDITLKEFYELNHIDLHIFCSEIHYHELIDFSYKTHPDWKLLDAIYCSSSLPIIFPPLLFENHCYCDGGLLLNYPLNICLKDGAKGDEILGLKLLIQNLSVTKIKDDSSILDYIFHLINKLIAYRSQKVDPIKKEIENEIIISTDHFTIETCYNAINSIEERKKLIQYGIECLHKKFNLK